MNIWEKVVLNMEKGTKKVAAAGATFAERVRAEVAIVRLRLRIDEVSSRIAELQRTIGRKLVDLQKTDALPKTTDQLLKDEDIVAAIVELADREEEIEELNKEIKNIQSDTKAIIRHTEDRIL
jgi:predicted  nucleic acid-binding Zn-ribbon protein